MKLLLTSGGICNSSIAASLEKLANKNRAETFIGFIPTAVNVEEGSKDWFLKQLTDLQKFGFTNIDFVDISAADIDWRTRLEKTDVIYVGGGNTFHLLDQARKVGFDSWIKSHINDKVYVGGSAGSIIATPTIALASVEPADINLPNLTELTGFNFVQFEICPHTPGMITMENAEKYAETCTHELYTIDDQSAIEVMDGQMNFVSEGSWKKIK